ncbi:hypothetical protein CsSME_00019831 [Camellia sinensis var. sinensis]
MAFCAHAKLNSLCAVSSSSSATATATATVAVTVTVLTSSTGSARMRNGRQTNCVIVRAASSSSSSSSSTEVSRSSVGTIPRTTLYQEGELERPRWTGETPLSRLVGALISFKPLYSLLKLGARQVLISRESKHTLARYDEGDSGIGGLQ